MEIFAETPFDDVTVQRIADAVAMTPAAVYYHFASKEQILLEGLERFSAELMRVAAGRLQEGGSSTSLVTAIVEWSVQHRVPATVFFVASVGQNTMVEAIRRRTRHELVRMLRSSVGEPQRSRPSDRAESGIVAVALLSLVESSLATLLADRRARRHVDSRALARIAELADRIAAR
jgi:AcrR family transcriptional regulator